VELFASQPGKYLELYVGKSSHVDYLTGYDHRGHTTCCWSVSTETQAREVEPRTASMEARLQAARTCQQAGYPVRIRFSPMVPTVGWEQEVRGMVRRMYELIEPEVLTVEPLRFCDYDAIVNLFRPGVLDPEYVESLRTIPDDAEDWQKKQFPDDLRIRLYRVVLEEVAVAGRGTPVALCREKRRVWDALRDDFERMGQDPDHYVCNCGPQSAGANPLLAGR
jgi:spore photoproduct lyase